MKSITIAATIFALASFVAAVPPFDPNGAKNVGNGKGAQFITGQCLSDTDCASGCCAKPTGICSGPGAATQQGKTGCGFCGGTSSPAPAAPKSAAPASATASKGGPPFDPSGAKNVGNGKGTQFIGGQCLSAADCASGCCANPSGICSGVSAQTQAGKTGCGFKAKRLVSVRSSEDLEQSGPGECIISGWVDDGSSSGKFYEYCRYSFMGSSTSLKNRVRACKIALGLLPRIGGIHRRSART